MRSRLPLPVRLTFALVSLLVSMTCIAQVIGLFPDETAVALKGRKALCESMAIQCSLAAQRGDVEAIRLATDTVLQRNREILSAAVRRADGRLVAEFGDHSAHWNAAAGLSTPTQVQVPVSLGSERWGAVELRFKPLVPTGWRGILADPAFRFIGFVCAGCLLVYYLYLRLILNRFKTPAAASGMPDRVRHALDTLVEGVLLLDNEQRIALANKAFAASIGRTTEELEGKPVGGFGWAVPASKEAPPTYPWLEAVRNGASHKGTLLEVETKTKGPRTFSVNATPIVGDDGKCRGALATFDDLTPVQKKNERMKRLLDKLKQSRTAIRHQNDQLRDLAKLDPLTACLNRRAFFEAAQIQWDAARRYGHSLSCFILDIDHFKSINDTYGHTTGDQALQHVAAVLKSLLRSSDLLCRYGGEEFCVLLPHEDAGGAARAAERFRDEIAGKKFSGISVTASFGVAAFETNVRDPHELLDRADKALYAAKRSGRNCVVRWDKLPDDLKAAGSTLQPPGRNANVESEVAIPFHAVTSLISALAFRDGPTAEHSRRVADLCVTVAQGLLSATDCYVLEVAALLHDIGKLGVPDSILRKPGPLTEQEWEVMGAHDRMAEEIITAAFASQTLTEIVHCHHAWFAGNPRNPALPTDERIPLGARILAIADAYDAMTFDRVYRKGCGPEIAFAELRRCAGKQFDPALVERFVRVMQERDTAREVPFPALSKKTAFRIGLQIEKLAWALDARDMSKLAVMASRLKGTAAEQRLPQIFEAAAHLEHAVAENADWLDIVQCSSDLLELCRSTQKSYLSTAVQASTVTV